jgi:hypothetical protein
MSPPRELAIRMVRRIAVPVFRTALRLLTGSRVASGPFAGMQYGTVSVGSVYNPKLLGTYEREIHRVLGVLAARRYELCVDIGAAEGYYAVGLALRLRTKVVCFEVEPDGRRLIRELAALNGVQTQVHVLGRCEPDELARVLADVPGRILVVCDVEGYEDVLLDPVLIPRLREVDCLVELHDALVPGVGARLEERFQPSHDIDRIVPEPRRASHFPAGGWWAACIPSPLKVRIQAEWRGPLTGWLWLSSRAPALGSGASRNTNA